MTRPVPHRAAPALGRRLLTRLVPGPSAVLVGALALAGVVVGHVISYWLTHRHASERTEALAGHSHLEVFGPALIVVGLAALVVLSIGLGRHGTRAGPGRVSPLRLGAVQAGLYLGLESIERLGEPGGVVQVIHEPAVVIGLVVQMAVACIAVLGLKAGIRLVHSVRFVATSGPARFGIRTIAPRYALVPIRVRADRSPISRRGPPTRVE